jgi:hypothetical protein
MLSFKPSFPAILFALSLSACATTQRTDLFFGMNIPGGGQVSDEQWKKFTDSVVSPRFREGYTEWDAAGKWQDTQTKQTISENTKVLTILGKANKQREALLDTVVQSYIRRFNQQAVLRVDTKAKTKFISAKP